MPTVESGKFARSPSLAFTSARVTWWDRGDILNAMVSCKSSTRFMDTLSRTSRNFRGFRTGWLKRRSCTSGGMTLDLVPRPKSPDYVRCHFCRQSDEFTTAHTGHNIVSLVLPDVV